MLSLPRAALTRSGGGQVPSAQTDVDPAALASCSPTQHGGHLSAHRLSSVRLWLFGYVSPQWGSQFESGPLFLARVSLVSRMTSLPSQALWRGWLAAFGPLLPWPRSCQSLARAPTRLPPAAAQPPTSGALRLHDSNVCLSPGLVNAGLVPSCHRCILPPAQPHLLGRPLMPSPGGTKPHA